MAKRPPRQRKTAIAVDSEEAFPRLEHSPVVEAVIELRARATVAWEERSITDRLKIQLPEYPILKAMRAFSFSAEFQLGPDQVSKNQPAAGSPVGQDNGWFGLRMESDDARSIGQFRRDGFSFSRLAPYQDWVRLSSEAIRLWKVYDAIARTSEVQRLGVRFINRIEVRRKNLRIGRFFRGFGEAPAAWPRSGFLHHDVLAVPDRPYSVNVIRTMQAPDPTNSSAVGLVLDIDVFSTEPFGAETGTINSKLSEMRSVKNQVFFSSVSKAALNLWR